MANVLVTGAGGFIGTHLVRRLKKDGHWVCGMDLKKPEWSDSEADEFQIVDLRTYDALNAALYFMDKKPDWVFALAADMGGMGFITTKDAEIIRNNTMISINSIEAARIHGVERYLYSSSACVYPMYRQTTASAPLAEYHVYPAQPQHSYGWEKLHTEHLCKYYREAGWLDTKIVRFHNTYGPEGAWRGGREKAPAALCRKIAVAKLTGNPEVEIWGDGKAIRSYTYIDDCVEGLIRLMQSDFSGPMNLGRDRTVSVDELADLIADIAGISIKKVHVPGPQGVRWRNSDNSLCKAKLGWVPRIPLEKGLVPTYKWIEEQVMLALEKGEEL